MPRSHCFLVATVTPQKQITRCGFALGPLVSVSATWYHHTLLAQFTAVIICSVLLFHGRSPTAPLTFPFCQLVNCSQLGSPGFAGVTRVPDRTA